MATDDPVVPWGMDANAVLTRAVDVLRDDIRLGGLKVLGGLLASVPLIGFFLEFAIDGLVVQLTDADLGSPAPEHSFGKRLLYGILSFIIMGIAIVIGFFLLVIPGIYLTVRLGLVVPAVWVDDKGPIQALSESWTRTRGHVLTVFAVQAVVFLFTMLILVPAVVLTVGTSESALEQFAAEPAILVAPGYVLASMVAAATVGAVGSIASVVMYRSFEPPEAPTADDLMSPDESAAEDEPATGSDEPDFQTD